MWLNQLKVAVATKDTQLLTQLLEDVPQSLSTEEMQSAVVLLMQARELVQALKDETANAMLQIQKNKDYLGEALKSGSASLDITS